MNIVITSIAKSINETDVILNTIIQEFIDGEYYHGKALTVMQWRLDNYSMLRAWAYPSIHDYLDAQVKKKYQSKYSHDGNDQEVKYLDICESVKIRFPKQ